MTEFELGEMIYNSTSSMASLAQVHFGLVSAYLVVSYMVGDKLTKVQSVIITTLYVAWVTTVIQGVFSESQTTLHLVQELETHGSTIGKSVHPSGIIGFLSVQVLGLIASLYFMWSIRHPRTE